MNSNQFMKIGNWFLLNYQISDLNGDQILKEVSLSTVKRNIDVLVIDDEEFPLLDELKRHEFNIEYKNDITSLKDVEPYAIILCDIHGVGRFLGSSQEGAYLVSSIKEKYPSKIVISYTADTTSPEAQKYLQKADNIIPKGTSIEDWASLLTSSVKDLANPVYVWKNIQKNLVHAHVSTRDIAYLEAKFVKAIKNGKNESLKNLSNEMSSPIKEILKQSLPILLKILLPKVSVS